MRLSFIKHSFARWRFNRMVATFDKQIADARKRHAPVRHIVRAKRAFVHERLRGCLS